MTRAPAGGSFVAGIVSGYAMIMVQALTGLLLVPFLLSERGVGLAGYGALATIQALAMGLTVALDGHRQASSRRIAVAAATVGFDGMAGLVLCTVLASAVVAGVLIALAPVVSQLAGLHFSGAAAALRLAFSCVVLEQYCYLLESALHAGRRSRIANALGAGDAVLRAGLVVLLFHLDGASLVGFFIAALIGLSLKAVVLSFLGRAMLRRPQSSWSSAVRKEFLHLVRSTPLSLNGVAPYLVFRVSVILGNKLLGPQAAGVLSIVLVTLRTYLNQTIFAAMRPLLVPRLATAEMTDPGSPAAVRLGEYLTVYTGAVLTTATLTVCATPFWLTLWLGEPMRQYAPAFMAALTIYFIEIVMGVPYYCLVARGQAQSLAIASGAAAVLALAALAGVASVPGASLTLYVLVVVAYVAAYSVLVRRYFRSRLRLPTRGMDAPLLLASGVIALGSWGVLAAARGAADTLVAAFVACLIVCLICHLTSDFSRSARAVLLDARSRS